MTAKSRQAYLNARESITGPRALYLYGKGTSSKAKPRGPAIQGFFVQIVVFAAGAVKQIAAITFGALAGAILCRNGPITASSHFSFRNTRASRRHLPRRVLRPSRPSADPCDNHVGSFRRPNTVQSSIGWSVARLAIDDCYTWVSARKKQSPVPVKKRRCFAVPDRVGRHAVGLQEITLL